MAKSQILDKKLRKENEIKSDHICTIKLLPKDQWVKAANKAVAINPANAPAVNLLRYVDPEGDMPQERIAVLTSKYWGNAGVRLTVGFLDNPPADLRARILSHMNAWGVWSNVQFVESATNPQVRIARTPRSGYWSYLGTDVLRIPTNQPTMNLDSFTMNTADSEFYRVVRHETGHTLGFPHEHMRKEIIDRIDRNKAIQYFMSTQGWSEQQVIAQVLTPLDYSALIASAQADINSIMCYWLPASIMKDNVAVNGGRNIDAQDATFASSIYPKILRGFQSLGGVITSNVAVGKNKDGRLEVFARGTDNAVWHIWQTAPNNGWSNWARLGGVITSDPIVVSNKDGRLEVFARGTDNALWHIWQTAPNNGWSNWSSLGGIITSNISVYSNADGRLEVFVRGTDSAVWHIWQTAPNNGWSSWGSLGGIIDSNVGVNRNADGRLEVFVRGTDNAVWHIWQTAPNNGWSSWASLGGTILSDPLVASNKDGRLEVFATGTNNAVWHTWQTAPNNGWSGWGSLGGIITSEISATKNADGRLEVFARGTDNAVWHTWQTAPNNGWSNWASLGGKASANPVVSSNSDGRLEVFDLNFRHELIHTWQTSPNNGWN